MVAEVGAKVLLICSYLFNAHETAVFGTNAARHILYSQSLQLMDCAYKSHTMAALASRIPHASTMQKAP
jgi:hypothetical protein